MSYYRHESILSVQPIKINGISPITIQTKRPLYWYPPTGGSTTRDYYPNYQEAHDDSGSVANVYVSQGDESGLAPTAFWRGISEKLPKAIHITVSEEYDSDDWMAWRDANIAPYLINGYAAKHQGLNEFMSYILLYPTKEQIVSLRQIDFDYLRWCVTSPNNKTESNWKDYSG